MGRKAVVDVKDGAVSSQHYPKAQIENAIANWLDCLANMGVVQDVNKITRSDILALTIRFKTVLEEAGILLPAMVEGEELLMQVNMDMEDEPEEEDFEGTDINQILAEAFR